MVDAGDAAPDFTLPAHSGEAVTLSDYRGKKNVVLSFHIHSFTGGWTHQVSSFRMADSALGEKDTQVLGISANAKPVQAAFSTSLGGIPYPILSDFHPHGEVAQAYGVFNADMGTSLRAVIVIDKAGVIRFKRVYANAGDLQTDDILAEVDKL